MSYCAYRDGFALCTTLAAKLGKHDGTEAAPRNFFRSCEYHKIVKQYSSFDDVAEFNHGYRDCWREICKTRI